ncbi:MAG: Gfo/Idh/MocA family oxidoreductase [Chromatiales bacterium]|jgi:predicted dehydrogenase
MINCAIIGCGQIAGGYDEPESDKVRTHAKAFQRHPGCRLVGVCDSSLETANRFSRTWDVPFATTDSSELLQQCKPDLLSICAPTEVHEEIFEIACKQNVARIWLEKPAADSSAAIARMINLSKQYQVDVWVNYFRRYDAGFQKIKQRIAGLGRIQHVSAFYTKGLRHNGSHMLDLLHWLFGPVLSVDAVELMADPEYPAMSGVLQTKMARIHLTALDYHHFELFELDIIGANGRIMVKDGGQQILFENLTDSKYYPGYRNLSLTELHDSSYSTFMQAGLEQGLNGAAMPGLEEEMAIQVVLSKCSLIDAEI